MKINKNVLRRLSQIIFSLILQGLCLFISAWSIKWHWAWIFIFLNIFILILNSFILPLELIEERGKKKKDAKKWDKILTKISIIPLLGINIISGLDYHFNWSGQLNIIMNIFSLVIYLFSSMFITWSMISNKYFSTMVRIQIDRGHQVASSGPYKYIRHPGYLGFIIMMFAIPLALGSLYGLILSVISAILFIIRTSLEDKTLKDELNGYLEYSENVKYKLIPFVW